MILKYKPIKKLTIMIISTSFISIHTAQPLKPTRPDIERPLADQIKKWVESLC